MNPTLVADFQEAAADLIADFGRPVTHTNGDGDEVTIQAVIRQSTDSLSTTDGWPQRQWTALVTKAAHVAPGDTLSYAGTVTADDPYPADVVWQIDTILNDDGFVTAFTIRQATA